MDCEPVLDVNEAPHQDWINERRKGLGGTDCASLLGHNPWKSVTSLYFDKTSEDLEPDEVSVGEAAYWGRTLEPVVAQEFTRRTGIITQPCGWHLKSTKYPFVRGTLDYWVFDGESNGLPDMRATSFLECKTTAWYRGRDWKNGLIPPYPRAQVLHYLALTGFDHCHLACLVGGQTFVHIALQRDKALIEEILEMEKRFWWYVENHIEPPDPFAAPDILDPNEFGKDEVLQVVQLTDEHVALLIEYWEQVRRNADSYDRVMAIREELEGLLYGARHGVWQGDTLIEWYGARSQRRFVIHEPEEIKR